MKHKLNLFSLLASVILLAGCATQSQRTVTPVGRKAAKAAAPAVTAPRQLTICSFNIQFLGNSTARDNAALADIVKGYDVVVVQELVAPPYAGKFPNGEAFKPDPQAARFFDAMRQHGFSFVLSEEDTGTGDTIHLNSTATEWWVTFYKPGKVRPAPDLPGGFLAGDRSNHPDYERVPYAFPFRAADGTADFVLISVHLMPGDGRADAARRKQELGAIKRWIDAQNVKEKDYVILGDMNIENATELRSVTPTGFISLNDECRPTNTTPKGPKPYDHVMIHPVYTKEIDWQFDFQVVNLINAMRPYWKKQSSARYPGDEPYDHNEFRKNYSDHHPVLFRLSLPTRDDD